MRTISATAPPARSPVRSPVRPGLPPARSAAAGHLVALAVTPGAPIFELAVPCEVFGVQRPDIADPWYEFRICATEPDTVVATGFLATAAGTMDDLAAADTVVIPACSNVHDEQPADLVAAVRDAHARGARIVGICSGAFVLAAAGLLDGRRATTHWMHAADLAARFPAVTVDAAVLYVQDAGVYTSAGTAAAIDLCLELVRTDHGSAAANELARRLVVPPHRTADQAQYVSIPMPAEPADGLGEVVDWARTNLHRQFTVGELARRCHLSTRTLIRRFHAGYGLSPGQWLAGERLRRARHLLESTGLSVERVARDAGFGTATSMRMAFAKSLHTSPTAYRSTFAHA